MAILEKIFKIISCLSPDFAKCRPYVIRIRIKWLTERFFTDAFTDEIYPDIDTDVKNSPNVISLVPFFIQIRNVDTDTDTETCNRRLLNLKTVLQCK